MLLYNHGSSMKFLFLQILLKNARLFAISLQYQTRNKLATILLQEQNCWMKMCYSSLF